MWQIIVGRRIKHRHFGQGTIARIDGSHVKIKINFDNKVKAANNSLNERIIFSSAEFERALKDGTISFLHDKERQDLFEKLKNQFGKYFLSADDFYQTQCSKYIPPDEYKRKKGEYVHHWVKEKLPQIKEVPDSEQADAIGSVNGHVQVVARAGSGKTATVVNRTLFLQRHCGVSPHEMLLLAFNHDAAEKMRKPLELELKDAIPHIMTFHALAYALVHPEKTPLHDKPGGSQSKSRVLQSVIDDCLHNPDYDTKIRDLMMAHFRKDWESIAMGGYNKSPEEMLRYRRSLPREGLDGQYYKSFGEKVIGNFLFEHDIKYKYERNFWWNKINYRPDFAILKGENHGAIIEYFGREGDPVYDEESKKKRRYWTENKNWHFLEFSPKDLKSTGVEGFCSLLKQRLEECGITCNHLNEETIWLRIKGRTIDRFTKLVEGFVGRCRKICISPKELSEKIRQHACVSDAEQPFLNLAVKFYKEYLEHLQETGEEDFDGLMQKAAEIVSSGNTVFRYIAGSDDLRCLRSGDLKCLHYVFIDEYQDFSELFHRLIMEIRKQNSNLRFFCVGDDWQAINGFAGSDLRFYDNFEQFFQPFQRLHLTTNYRSASSIIDIGNALMQGFGIPAHASKEKDTKGFVAVADLDEFKPTLEERENHPGDLLTPAVLRLVIKAVKSGQNVVLLSRTNQLPFYVNYGEYGKKHSGLDQFLGLVHDNLSLSKREREMVTISTVHKYKGLEGNFVIVIDAVTRRYPLLHPDWVFTRVLGDSVERVIAEERRLFYVALTRAKEKLVIVTEKNNPSPFLETLRKNIAIENIDWCDYPPLVGFGKRIFVRVAKQNGHQARSTYAIKDMLKAEGYLWSESEKTWSRTLPADGFSPDRFFSQSPWTTKADGIEIRFDLEKIPAIYRVDGGKWKKQS